MCTSNGNHNHSTTNGAILNLDLMDGNQQTAVANQARFDAAGVRCLNLMSSPGTGKTTLLESTLGALDINLRTAVLEGDMTTELDADRLRAYGVPVVAITTGRACHLDADMIAAGLDRLDLAALDLVFIENVG
ncbi:MAG: hydrogenase nickel incorporation protein HypB, partial [Anaerolineae bacterium]|nr:hydrogenase nickel incorporation protein HypB [Anaerolineae bacterium]